MRTIYPDTRRNVNESTPYGAYPWQAQIAVLEREDDLRHFCSGVILSEKYVLTAASCLTSQPMMKYRIVVGQHFLGRGDDIAEKTFSIQSIYIHDKYDDMSGDNDIALVKVKQIPGFGVFKFSDHVSAACLPNFDLRVDKSSPCEISSWDVETQEESVSEREAEENAAQSSLQSSTVPVLSDPCFRTSAQKDRSWVCAGTKSNRFECNLDKGTPLVCNVRKRLTIVGILTRKSSCDAASAPMVIGEQATNDFIRVSQYSEWIRTRLNL